ncbi:hypothetical protein [Nocardia caishijiensis]|uniref:Uncharacterized protein n=1 Tax=Nocardia caishijiensis TaxID=184756 RepID=A0ABQ6YPZ8_9NOCA|nr:hypothetical protein [Nocardia caishijiensis]KAF0847640.1 hypothetical protein FNL39_103542 [Nocardia caishijiensis]
MTQTSLPARALMPPPRPSASRPRLDRLSTATPADLHRMFTEAPAATAATFARLDGDLVMRTFPAAGAYLGRLMARPSYFWTGKSFRHTDDRTAFGHNFFQLLGGLRALNFVATVGDSVVDARPAVRLDYNDTRVGSRRPARRIYDELREVEPDLWLGPSFLLAGRKRQSMGWFALDRSVPFTEIGLRATG